MQWRKMVDLSPIKNVAKASAVMIIPRMLYRGVILYFCWMWFIVEYGLPPMDYWTATIIGGLISTLTFEHIGETKSISEAYAKMIEWFIGINVFFVAAFLIHLALKLGIV